MVGHPFLRGGLAVGPPLWAKRRFGHPCAVAADISLAEAARILIAGSLLVVFLAPPLAACPLCSNDSGVPIQRLTPAEALAMVRAFAQQNESRLARIDALLQSGALGPPNAGAARKRAHCLARLSLRNVYPYLFQYASDPERVYEADATAFAGVFAKFCEPGLFTIARLRRVRMGAGHVCVQYDLADLSEGVTMLGGRSLHYRVEDRAVEGARRRLLVLGWPSGTVGSVEILLAEHYTFRVSHVRSDGPPAPYELFAADDVQGGWVRRWGLHRPAAFMFWVSPLDQGRLPAWLVRDGAFTLKNWRGLGPVPAAVRERFPNR